MINSQNSAGFKYVYWWKVVSELLVGLIPHEYIYSRVQRLCREDIWWCLWIIYFICHSWDKSSNIHRLMRQNYDKDYDVKNMNVYLILFLLFNWFKCLRADFFVLILPWKPNSIKHELARFIMVHDTINHVQKGISIVFFL